MIIAMHWGLLFGSLAVLALIMGPLLLLEWWGSDARLARNRAKAEKARRAALTPEQRAAEDEAKRQAEAQLRADYISRNF